MMKLLFVLLALVCVVHAEKWPRLIQVNETGPAVWMTPEELLEMRLKRKTWPTGFQDITDTPNLNEGIAKSSVIPDKPAFQQVVEPLLPRMTANNLGEAITTLQNYHTRYYTTQTGLESAQWIRDKFIEYAGSNPAIEVELFEHDWLQPSVICRWKGEDDERVILGAHEDSTAGSANSRAPGADDDASGVVQLLETFRVLAAYGEQSGFKPKHTVEFHAYAAEEVGLRGARAIANDYKSKGITVKSMVEAEMAGYVGRSRTIVILDDTYTNSALNSFMVELAKTYTGLSTVYQRCNYGCSDHAAWADAGYDVACSAEAGPSGGANPYMHSANDLLVHLDTSYILEFAKLNLGYIVELSMHA